MALEVLFSQGNETSIEFDETEFEFFGERRPAENSLFSWNASGSEWFGDIIHSHVIT